MTQTQFFVFVVGEESSVLSHYTTCESPQDALKAAAEASEGADRVIVIVGKRYVYRPPVSTIGELQAIPLTPGHHIAEFE